MKNITRSAGMLLATALIPGLSVAGVTYKDGDKYIKIGGRVQM